MRLHLLKCFPMMPVVVSIEPPCPAHPARSVSIILVIGIILGFFTNDCLIGFTKVLLSGGAIILFLRG